MMRIICIFFVTNFESKYETVYYASAILIPHIILTLPCGAACVRACIIALR